MTNSLLFNILCHICSLVKDISLIKKIKLNISFGFCDFTW